MLECGQQVPEELEEGAKHFSECLERLQGKVQGTIHWRQERDYLIKQLNKLVSASKDTINHTDITYEDFGTAVAESISSNSFPEVITCKKAAESQPPVSAPVQKTAPAEEVVELVEEQAKDAEPENEEDVAVENDADTPAQEDVENGEAAEETNQEVNEEAAEERKGEDGVRRGRGGRGGRGRGDRGHRARGGRGGRGRGGFYRNGEDAEGFTVVKEDGEAGRGKRGGRGFRGGRGGPRGGGFRGERGAFRGARGRPATAHHRQGEGEKLLDETPGAEG